MTGEAPLILTLALDERSFAFFDGERRQYFPADRNFIPAHVTLFHHLPGDELAAIGATLAAVTRAHNPFSVAVTGLRPLGRGVAYRLESSALAVLRGELAARWKDWLTPQDAQRFQPHVTIQNKADPAQARALLQRLEQGFSPFSVKAEGLHLWRYLGGPWEAVETFRFAERE
jgi:2'-5' RNA ligase